MSYLRVPFSKFHIFQVTLTDECIRLLFRFNKVWHIIFLKLFRRRSDAFEHHLENNFFISFFSNIGISLLVIFGFFFSFLVLKGFFFLFFYCSFVVLYQIAHLVIEVVVCWVLLVSKLPDWLFHWNLRLLIDLDGCFLISLKKITLNKHKNNSVFLFYFRALF